MSFHSSRRRRSLTTKTQQTRAHSAENGDTQPVPTGFGKALDQIFASYSGIPFGVRVWDGTEWHSSIDAPVFMLLVNTNRAWDSLGSASDEAELGSCYVGGELDVEGDLFLALRALPMLEACVNSSTPRTVAWLRSWSVTAAEAARRLLKLGTQHTLGRDAADIAYHYDKPSPFYRLWLGPSMVYSCAFFEDWSVSLDTAQCDKLNLICRKLGLKPHDRLLDVGCGWGSLVTHAAKHFGAAAHGVSLSKEQIRFAEAAIQAEGLTDACQVYLKDYRELRDVKLKFDKVASVGMCEHVGSRHIGRYFREVSQMLVDGGLFLNHGITRSMYVPKKRTSFIDRYVFPDGELLTLSEMVKAAELAGFEVRDVEDLREHYEETLRHWVNALRANRTEVIRLTSVETYRLYELYMTGSAEAFRRGDIALHQLLLSKNASGRSSAVKTRSEWYCNHNRAASDGAST